MDNDPPDTILNDKSNSAHDDDGTDPEVLAPDLLTACKENDTSRAQHLLTDGVPPGYSDPGSGWSCLHWSVYNENRVLTRALLQAGAAAGYKRTSAIIAQGRQANKHNSRRPKGSNLLNTDTPLHWSAYRGNLGITWILLKEGYSSNDYDNMGNTTTHLAAANGHERVLDTLIQDGADVHVQNKFKNTPFDVSTSVECRSLLSKAMVFPAPSVDEAESMHITNLQRILEVERTLTEVAGYLEPKTDERPRQKRQQHLRLERDNSGSGEEEEQSEEHKIIKRSYNRDQQEQEPDGVVDSKSEIMSNYMEDRVDHEKLDLSTEVKENEGDARLTGANGDRGKGGGEGKENVAEGDEIGDSRIERGGAKRGSVILFDGENSGAGDKHDDVGYHEESEESLLAKVKLIREAIEDAEALCICDDLVAVARLRIDGLLLQHSIEKQAAAVVASEPVLTQEVYTTTVNRLALLLKRANGNPRIPSQLKKRAEALVEKSHAEYWLQVIMQRLLKVECAEARHLPDMAKLEACINKAAKARAQSDLVRDSRLLLKRLSTEVEIREATDGFPVVRLPIEVMPKGYWQPEDTGHIEETEGFPLPPVDAEGKSLEYVWIASDSLRSLLAACEKMTEALFGAEDYGVNPTLAESGKKMLEEHQRKMKALEEKDAVDRGKAVATAKKAAKKLKKKKKKKKEKKKK